MRIAACLLVFFACGTRRQVFTSDGGTDANAVLSCAQALRDPQPGLPCAFREACIQEIDPCCSRALLCESGVLRVGAPSCVEGCAMCGSDRVCPPRTICEGGLCQPCPMFAECEGPTGWARLTRNGCPMCDFAPQGSACSDASVCMGLECYVGSTCARGCTAPEDCCVNVCAERGCPPLAPLGCASPCPDGSACMLCATTSCRCGGSEWECVVECVDGTFTPSCMYP